MPWLVVEDDIVAIVLVCYRSERLGIWRNEIEYKGADSEKVCVRALVNMNFSVEKEGKMTRLVKVIKRRQVDYEEKHEKNRSEVVDERMVQTLCRSDERDD